MPPRDRHRKPEAPRPFVLRDYALLADGHRSALVDPDGNVAWMCFPTFHDPALFAGIWGTGGCYKVSPEARAVWGGSYEPGTLIWVSRWDTETGLVESRDALAFPGEAGHAVLLRRLRALGEPQAVVVELELSTDYGRAPIDAWHHDGGVWRVSSPPLTVLWQPGGTARAVRLSGGRCMLRRRVVVKPGEPVDLVLELVLGDEAGSHVEAASAWRQTEHAWRSAVPAQVNAVAARDVRHAIAVLRGLTAPSGGTVAASTASLPERAREGRDYDYRYVWIRDLCYIGQAGAALGAAGEPMLDDAVRFVTARLDADAEKLMPAYTVDGEPVPTQRRLQLPGYPGGHDVVGNHVRSQFQLDGLGEPLLLFAAAARAGRLDAEGWGAAQRALDAVEQRWREPDAGLWELDDRFWAHSRLCCVAGIRAICEAGAPADWATRYLPLADAVLAETSRTCLHPTGRWQRAPEDPRVDAALLLSAIRGALPVQDPRSVATKAAVAQELGRDGYVFRYAHDERGADLGTEEGAFLICSFWMSLHCTMASEHVESVRHFERARASCGPPGLLAEEFDVEQRQLAGNLPQSFVHAALIEAAVAQAAQESQGR